MAWRWWRRRWKAAVSEETVAVATPWKGQQRQRVSAIVATKYRHGVSKRCCHGRLVALRATTKCRGPSSTTPAQRSIRPKCVGLICADGERARLNLLCIDSARELERKSQGVNWPAEAGRKVDIATAGLNAHCENPRPGLLKHVARGW